MSEEIHGNAKQYDLTPQEAVGKLAELETAAREAILAIQQHCDKYDLECYVQLGAEGQTYYGKGLVEQANEDGEATTMDGKTTWVPSAAEYGWVTSSMSC